MPKQITEKCENGTSEWHVKCTEDALSRATHAKEVASSSIFMNNSQVLKFQVSFVSSFLAIAAFTWIASNCHRASHWKK